MKKLWFIFSLLTILMAVFCSSKAVKTANPNSHRNAQILFNYLYELPQGDENRVLSGIYGLRFPDRTDVVGAEDIFNKTGKWVALVGDEYCKSSGCQPSQDANEAIVWEKVNPLLIEHAQKGGVVRILTHFPNPCNKTYSGLWDSTANIDAILTDGTPERLRWLALLDEVANGLRDLETNNVTAIYGPIHEMNGWWFWWCEGMPNMTAEKFKQLWIDQFNYLTYEKKCNNILWLFAFGGGPEINMQLYPGDEYVDIVGIDVYNPSLESIKHKFETIATIGKPMIIAEFGPKGQQGKFDYTTVINDLKNVCPNVVAIMSWHAGGHDPLTNLNGEDYINDPWIVTRDEVSY